jgi:hypothetical protein
MQKTNPGVDSNTGDSRREFVKVAIAVPIVLATIQSRTVWAKTIQTPGSACGSACTSNTPKTLF